MGGIRRFAVGILFAAFLLGTPALASGLEVSRDDLVGLDQGFKVRDDEGASNAITIGKSRQSNTLRIADAADTVELGERRRACSVSSTGHAVHCLLHREKFLVLTIFSGGGNDTVMPDTRFPKKDGRTFALIGTKSGNDRVYGGAGPAVIQPGQGNDVARGGGNRDFVIANDNDGGDRLIGGGGRDYLGYFSERSPVHVDLRRAGYGGPSGDLDWIADFEGVAGGAGDDELIAGHGANIVNGGGGADMIRTGSGNDRVAPEKGADRVATGAGDDRVSACCDSSRDRIVCGPGRDTAVIDKRDVTYGCERVRTGRRFPTETLPYTSPARSRKLWPWQPEGAANDRALRRFLR